MIIVFIMGGYVGKTGDFCAKVGDFLRYARSFFDSWRAFTDNATGYTVCVSPRCVYIRSVFAQTAFDEKHK